MHRVSGNQGKLLVVMLLAVSLLLTLSLPEGHSHTTDIGPSHVNATADEHGHPGDDPVADHAGCHATVFCAGAVFASKRPWLSPVSGESSTAPSIHDLYFSSVPLSSDPPPPRLS